MKRIIIFIAIVGSLASFSATVTTDGAQALNPREQTTVVGTVNLVYWDLVKFWGPRTNPGVNYYNNNNPDWYVNAACGWTSAYIGSQGFYCPGTQGIYLDATQQFGNLQQNRDGAVALWLAHEFGHHIEELLGINWRAYKPYQELLADCFAGMYFRYGVNTSRLLNYDDYRTDARNEIWTLSDNDYDHGTRQQRLRAFDFGYTQTNYNGCINGAGRSY